MKQQIGCVSLLVHDYDEAIEFFTKKLGFQLVKDTDLGVGFWLLHRAVMKLVNFSGKKILFLDSSLAVIPSGVVKPPTYIPDSFV